MVVNVLLDIVEGDKLELPINVTIIISFFLFC